MKEVIYKLYQQTLTPDVVLARNAVYRYMWKHYRNDKISIFQKDYRDHVKGLRLTQLSDFAGPHDATHRHDVELIWHSSQAKHNRSKSVQETEDYNYMMQQLFNFRLDELVKKDSGTEEHQMSSERDKVTDSIQILPEGVVGSKSSDGSSNEFTRQQSLINISSPSVLPIPSQCPPKMRELDWVDILRRIKSLEQVLNQMTTSLNNLKAIVLVKCQQQSEKT